MPYNWNKFNRKKHDKRNDRPDHQPGHRGEYERNRKRVLASENICAICGRPVNKALKFPDPAAPTIDHIIPVSRGGHPSAIENLQLAHALCNRIKADKLNGDADKKTAPGSEGKTPADIKHGLPWSMDWTQYRADEEEETSNAAILAAQAEQLKAQGYIITAAGIMPIR